LPSFVHRVAEPHLPHSNDGLYGIYPIRPRFWMPPWVDWPTVECRVGSARLLLPLPTKRSAAARKKQSGGTGVCVPIPNGISARLDKGLTGQILRPKRCQRLLNGTLFIKRFSKGAHRSASVFARALVCNPQHSVMRTANGHGPLSFGPRATWSLHSTSFAASVRFNRPLRTFDLEQHAAGRPSHVPSPLVALHHPVR
jgi:hypothetical protein